METPIHFSRDMRSWVDVFVEKGDAMVLDRRTLKDAFRASGADFMNLTREDHERIRKAGQTNKNTAPLVRKVWGKIFYEDYKTFCEEWVAKFEKDPNNRPLPKLKNKSLERAKPASGSKISGMLHLLHFATLYASGDMTTHDFSEFMETMDHNGHLWQERMDHERKRVMFNGEMTMIGSLPPGFSKDAWNFILNSRKNHV